MSDDKQEFKRQTAYKCSIASLNTGVFVKKTGWESSYVMTDYGDFSRVDIIAVVVAKDGNSITLDDGTGNMDGRFFDKPEGLTDVNVGDLVLVIARPREFNNKIYLTLEIIRRIEKGWINYRKRELTLIKKLRSVQSMNMQKDPTPEIVESISTTSSKEKIINVIKQLDTGSGASIDDVMILSKVSNAEDIVQDMVMRGEIFEFKPGKLKMM